MSLSSLDPTVASLQALLIDKESQLLHAEQAHQQTLAELQQAKADAVQLQLFNELMQKLGMAAEEGEFFHTTAIFLPRILPNIQRASIALLTAAGDHLELFALEGQAGSIPIGTLLPAEGTIVGLTVREQRPVLLGGEDFARSPLLDIRKLSKIGMRAALTAPLISGGRSIGSLNTASLHSAAFRPGDEALLLKIALLLAAHAERWQLLIKLKARLAEAQRHEQQLQQAKVTALRAAQAISSEMSLEKVLEQILRIVVTGVEAHRGVLISRQDGKFGGGAALSVENEKWTFAVIQDGAAPGGIPKRLIEHIAHTRETVKHSDVTPDKRFIDDPYFALHHPRALLGLALVHGGRLTGILYLENYADSEALTQDRIELLSLLSAQAAGALENSRLFVEAHEMSEKLRHANAELVRHSSEQLSIAEKRLQEELSQRVRTEQERAALQEQVIRAQTQRLAELSTPLIPITDSIVVMPLVGSMDSARADLVLETALQGAQSRRARIVIIDITGMKQVDSHAAGSLINTANALRLLGAETLITGIRAEVAQTLIGLGIDLAAIRTRSTLQSAIAYALARSGPGPDSPIAGKK